MAKRLLIAVALALLVPATSWAQVTNVLAWAMNDSYPTAVGSQDIAFAPQSGSSDRLLVVFLSAESSSQTFNLESVTYGGEELTVESSFITPSSSAYGNLNWFGYLNESQLSILADENQPLRVNWGTPVPTGVTGDAPQIHYAIYAGVDQTDPIAARSTNGVDPGQALAIANELTSLDGDYWIGFNLAGQPATGTSAPGADPQALDCPSSPSAWTEENEAGSGVVGNGHATAVCSLATDGDGTQTATPSFGSDANTRRGVTVVVLRDDPPVDPGNIVELLGGTWQLDTTPDTQGGSVNTSATFSPLPGTQRLVTVFISAETDGSVDPGTINMSSVSLGNQPLTEVNDFTAGSNADYHNLNWFGYLDEAGITAMVDNTLTIVFGTPVPSHPFGQTRIHMATYDNVSQTTPIEQAVTADTGTSTANTLTLASQVIGSRDGLLAFAVLGQPGTVAIASGYTEHIDENGGGNDHTAAVYSRDSTSPGTEAITFTASITNRMAVQAAVLGFGGTAPGRRVMTVH